MAFTCQRISFLQILVIALINFVSSDFNSPYYELPTAIFPTKYRLHINTDIHRNISTYNGSVTIDLTIRESTNKIVLNSKELQIFNISLTNIDSGLILKSPKLQYEIDEVKEQLLINWPLFPLKLKIGQEYRLRIEFDGNSQKKDPFGFYKTTYLDDKNISIPIATTQFEPMSARQAFPCFDDLAFKAKFTISITHGRNYTAISNMPEELSGSMLGFTSNEEMTTTTFLETPKMSPYLVAFAVTNFNNISISVNGITHRVFFPPNSKENYSQVLDNSIKSLTTLEKYLGIKYSLQKLDHIGISKIFGAAMENWGLIIFEKNSMLSSKKNPNKQEWLNLINVQNHEIAHQWFGNLVTPESMTYWWLKEGLSTYFSFHAGNSLYPNEKVIEHFLTTQVLAHNYKYPLTNAIKEGSDMGSNLNIIPYMLGSSIVRMFHNAIGDSTFLNGIYNFLSTCQYSVANEDDFINALQAAVDENEVKLFQNNHSVAEVMHTWTHNHGIPTITIIRNYDTGTITIRQKSNTEHVEEKWWIPLNFATATNPNFERTTPDYIMPPEAEVTLDLKDLNISLSNSDWLIVNKQQTGAFYTAYDDLNLKLIAEALQLNHKSIHLFNRALIFRDLHAIFYTELGSMEPILELLQYLRLEEESLPWYEAISIILKLISKLEGSKTSEKFKNFIYEISSEMFRQKYVLENLTATDMQIKNSMLLLNFKVDTQSCQNYTTNFPKDYFTVKIDKTKRTCAHALCQRIKYATLEEFKEFFTKMIISSHILTEFHQFKTALRCVESEEHLSYLYNFFFEGINRIENFENSKNLACQDLLISNIFFRTFVDRLAKNEMIEKLCEEHYQPKLKKPEEFLRKYGNNINAWLDDYFKNSKDQGISNNIEY